MADVHSTESPETIPARPNFTLLLAPHDDDRMRADDIVYGLHGICVSLADVVCGLSVNEPIGDQALTRLAGLAIAARNHAETLYDRVGNTSTEVENAVAAALTAEQAEEGGQHA